MPKEWVRQSATPGFSWKDLGSLIQDGLKRGEQCFRGDGLGEMAVGSRAQACADVFFGGVGRQHDDREACLTGGDFQASNLLDRRQTVHHRHLHVHQDKIRPLTLEDLHRLLTVLDADHLRRTVQHDLHDTAVGGMIICDKHLQKAF